MINYPDDLQKVKGTLAGGGDVYEGVPAKEQMNIFYPPQVKIFSQGEHLAVFCSFNLEVFFSPKTQSTLSQIWTKLQRQPC